MTQKFYAGIGSRETPEFIQRVMRNLAAHLYTQGWWLRSGGAIKADEAFETGHDNTRLDTFGGQQKEIYLPWKGYNNSRSSLHPGAIPFTPLEMAFAENHHPNWRVCSPGARKMHVRNGRILRGLEVEGKIIPVKFVLCWTKNGVTTGGTGQAIRMANALEIPVFNLGTAPNSVELERMINEIERFQKGQS